MQFNKRANSFAMFVPSPEQLSSLPVGRRQLQGWLRAPCCIPALSKHALLHTGGALPATVHVMNPGSSLRLHIHTTVG